MLSNEMTPRSELATSMPATALPHSCHVTQRDVCATFSLYIKTTACILHFVSASWNVDVMVGTGAATLEPEIEVTRFSFRLSRPAQVLQGEGRLGSCINHCILGVPFRSSFN